ncbi:MAG TPA: hypothetical protein VK574_07640 [Terracidiphilus sp.]|nr:hypothetical protein [Terracidiphilus sp.]
MSRDKKLFPHRRVCDVCGIEALKGAKASEGAPNIVAISMTIYRRGLGKGQLRAAGKVCACEKCLTFALADGDSPQAFGMLGSLLQRISDCYSGLLEDDSPEETEQIQGEELFA